MACSFVCLFVCADCFSAARSVLTNIYECALVFQHGVLSQQWRSPLQGSTVVDLDASEQAGVSKPRHKICMSNFNFALSKLKPSVPQRDLEMYDLTFLWLEV